MIRYNKLCSILLSIAVVLSGGVSSSPAADRQFEISVTDRDTGRPIAVRMHLKNAAGRVQKPPKAPFWHDHFVFSDRIVLKLPRGSYMFEIEHGPEYLTRTGHFTIDDFADDRKAVDLGRFIDMSKEGWWSGDLDVRRNTDDLALIMQAEDLHVVPATTWWNEKWEAAKKPPVDRLLMQSDGNRFYHLMAGGDSRAGGTLLHFNRQAPVKLVGATAEFPPAVEVSMETREQENGWIDASRLFDWDLPVWVANGAIDSVQLINRNLLRESVVDSEAGGKPRDKNQFPGRQGNGLWSQAIYYHLLECGLRIPPSAGSGSGVVANPVGYNRVYAYVEGELTYEKWWDAVKAGRVLVTNGPLMRPLVEGQFPGHVFQVPAGESIELETALTLSTRDKISYLEIVKNGKVVHNVRLDELAKKGGKLPKLKFDSSGWFLIRAECDTAKTLRYATTGPYYVEVGGKPRVSKTSAQFFLDWVNERTGKLKIEDPAQKEVVLKYHRAARNFFQDLVAKATDDGKEE